MRKGICVFLIVLLLCTVLTPAAETGYICGDLNNDKTVDEMLDTEEGKLWATNFDATGSLVNKQVNHAWSYDPEYLAQKMSTVDRYDKFNLAD